jgi:hypothetical protein
MLPTIRDGDTLIVEPAAIGQVRVGDIVLYKSGTALIAHRVESIARKSSAAASLRLRGDASESPDAPVLREQVIGRVVAVERGGRRIGLNDSPWGLIGRVRRRISRLKCILRRSLPGKREEKLRE